MSRPTRDEYGLQLAGAAAVMADCTRRKVGAAIVNPTTHQVVALGYNGLASGKPGCLTAGACPRGQLSRDEMPSYADGNHDYSNCRAIHAEVNAILWAGGRPGCVGMTMYVTDEPCYNCGVLIEGAGIARVVIPTNTRLGVVPLELARP